MEKLRSTQPKTDQIDYLAFFNTLKSKWYYYAATLGLAFVITFLINYYAVPVYEVNSSILIGNTDNQEEMMQPDLLTGFGLFSQVRDLQNELALIESSPLIRNAVRNLNLKVSIFERKKNLKKVRLYNKLPFAVAFDTYAPTAINMEYKIDFINDSEFTVKARKKNVAVYSYFENKTLYYLDRVSMKETYNINDEVQTEFAKFKIIPTNEENADITRRKFIITFNSMDNIVGEVKTNLEVGLLIEESSIAKLTYNTTNIDLGLDILKSLNEEYLKQDLEKKNYKAVNTIKYIDSQISEIEDSLSFAEEKLQNYRSNRQVIDINILVERIYQQMQSLETAKSNLEVQQRYYQYILTYFEESKDISDLLAPSSMGIEDPILNNMILELTTLHAHKVSLISNNQSKNPYLQSIDIKLENLIKTITENIKYTLNTNEMSLKDIAARISKLNAQLNALPKTERELIGFERKFKLNDAIYTFLLQRRAEAQIARSSNTPDGEIIEPEQLSGITPIFPKKKRNYLISFFLALLLPTIFIPVYAYLGGKITGKNELTRLSSFPVIGEIPNRRSMKEIILIDKPDSAVAESFRNIRSNLQFITQGTDNHSFLFTSSISQEGKSFIAANFAISLAMLNKKVLLIDFDLRKPTLHKILGLSNEYGVSSYYANLAGLDQAVQQTTIENLDFLPAGPIPPNPAELISSAKTRDIIEFARSSYNYVILDSAPIGLVTDAKSLMPLVKSTLFVVRQGFTPRRLLEKLISSMELLSTVNLHLVLNDIRNGQGEYGYKYGYKYGYYSDKSQKKVLKKDID